jgi:hypothetical protein
VSISFQTMRDNPATSGSAWKVDSCSVTAMAAQMLSGVGGRRSAAKAVKMSAAQPSRSFSRVGRIAGDERSAFALGSG